MQALIQIMLKFIDNRNVVERCLSALANLGFNSDSNVKEIILHGGKRAACGVRCVRANALTSAAGVEATLKVMQKWKNETGVLQLALILMNNCMYGSESNKVKVGLVCGTEIVQVVARHYKDIKTFNAANKAQGNLSVLDANIRIMVDAHATKYIVQGMDVHTNDVTAQQGGW
jgi:hypothetical protein